MSIANANMEQRNVMDKYESSLKFTLEVHDIILKGWSIGGKNDADIVRKITALVQDFEV